MDRHSFLPTFVLDRQVSVIKSLINHSHICSLHNRGTALYNIAWLMRVMAVPTDSRSVSA